MTVIVTNLALRTISDSEMDNFASDKVNRLDNNPNFTSVQVVINKIKTALAAYILLQNMHEPTKSDTAKKQTLRKQLERLLTSAASLCKEEAQGDLSYFLESGFNVSTKKGPLDIMMKPEKFNLDLGNNPGELDASMEPFHKCKGYSFAWTMDPITPASVWIVIPCPRKKCTMDGFASGAKVWVKGGAVSPDGTIVYSDPQSRIVQ